MLCKNPFHKEGLAFGCGQCLPCKINKRRIWAHRIMLESYTHQTNSFLTLTYSDEELPKGETLIPDDPRKFIKSLRQALDRSKAPRKIRYFLAGEYGTGKGVREHNPHYHLALFNYPPCVFGIPPIKTKAKDNQCYCNNCSPIRDAWGKGKTFNAQLSIDSAEYIAKYVCKSLTTQNQWSKARLGSRHLEFARMSNRPGIGAPAIEKIAQIYETKFGQDELRQTGDVAYVLNTLGKNLPLGRYLRDKLRLAIGRPAGTPTDIIEQLKIEKQIEDTILQLKYSGHSYYQHKNQHGKIAQLEAKQKLYQKDYLL